MGVESNVELMGFVLSEYWLANQKVCGVSNTKSNRLGPYSHKLDLGMEMQSIRVSWGVDLAS
jgi:hypothetical protein